jgi:c(7)-type cytochrome triheme protein
MACHPKPFEERLGASVMTMAEMQNGKFCGACHDGASAFGLFECNTCHTPVPAGADSLP